MAPSRLHAIYGGGSKIPHDKSMIHSEEEDIKEESKTDNLSDSPEELEIHPNKSEIQDPEIIAPLVDGGDSNADKEDEASIHPEEEDIKEESPILPDSPLVDGGDLKTNKEEESSIPPEDSPLNEVDRLFANLTGGSQTNNTNSSDYIYKLIEPEDLRLWLYDEQLQMSNDVSGGAENDDQSNDSHMKSSPYYSEFQALIDGLI